jgi:deazaflavin-dependent oxidoreductase (nitroreductase family)
MAGDYIRWVPGVRVMKLMGRVHARLYRATRGRLGARADGLDMLLLTTRGRRTGKLRTTALPFFRDGNDLVLIASFGGNDRDPAWRGNLAREPKLRVQFRSRSAEIESRTAQGIERERLWKTITADHPRYLEYQRSTEREIPVVVLIGAATLL